MEMQRIDIDTPGELARWAAQLAVPPDALAAAVRTVGTDVDKVKGYLASLEAEAARQPPGAAAARPPGHRRP